MIECEIFGNVFTTGQLSKRFAYLYESRKAELVLLKNNLDKEALFLIVCKESDLNLLFVNTTVKTTYRIGSRDGNSRSGGR